MTEQAPRKKFNLAKQEAQNIPSIGDNFSHCLSSLLSLFLWFCLFVSAGGVWEGCVFYAYAWCSLSVMEKCCGDWLPACIQKQGFRWGWGALTWRQRPGRHWQRFLGAPSAINRAIQGLEKLSQHLIREHLRKTMCKWCTCCLQATTQPKPKSHLSVRKNFELFYLKHCRWAGL